MRQRLGIAPTDDILAAVDSWDPEKRAWGYKVILDLEIEARSRLKIMPGVPELSAMLDARGIPRGLLTRNIRSAVEHFHENFPLPAFAPSVTRECAFEYKPDPAGLLHMCDTWGIFPRECVLVGDSLKDDVRCGNRAGAVTVWFNFENKPTPNFADMDPEQRPTHVVTSMQQLQRIIEEQYHLLQPAVAAKAVAAN